VRLVVTDIHDCILREWKIGESRYLSTE
jgi:hypothetical protein